jgi:hypothetical protein
MRCLCLALLLIAVSVSAVGNQPSQVVSRENKITNTPAFELLLVQKAEIEAALKTLSTTYTSQHPNVLQTRDGLEALIFEMDNMLNGGLPVDKLTTTYGELILRKATLEADLKTLLRNNTSQTPIVIRQRNRIEALNNEIERYLIQDSTARRAPSRRSACRPACAARRG